MSVKYVTVQWTRPKIVYDVMLVVGVAIYIAAFQVFGAIVYRGPHAISGEVIAMRAWGSCAFLMLTAILCIGPLARLDRRFVPLLYNRRHFGVLMSVVAVMHARQVLGFYHAFSNIRPVVSLLTWDTAITPTSIPFQICGAIALVIVLVMAATSHDFWQRFLGAKVWKSLHMFVYLAYALIVVHVAYGALQYELHPVPTILFGLSVLVVASLHVIAAIHSTRVDRKTAAVVELDGKRWLDAGSPMDVPRDRAKPVCGPSGERIALVRKGDVLHAVHGVCAHQGGPLYEGKVIDGCLTCPWHGWTYKPEDGRSPPPFTELIPTYRLRLDRGRVLVDPEPLAPGTPTDPIAVDHE
jgi:methionine sulfoxide reductase heme-binding subunit